MHDYKKYDRSFILLLPESGGFAAEGQKLSGTAILEIRSGKGKVTVNIQGLKPSAASIYRLYLISSRDGGAVGVCCGTLIPDARGKTGKTWEFDPENVAGSGLEYVDFNVVAVIVKSAEMSQNEIVAPVAGYKNGVVIWKSGFREHSEKKDAGRELITKTHDDAKEEAVEDAVEAKDAAGEAVEAESVTGEAVEVEPDAEACSDEPVKELEAVWNEDKHEEKHEADEPFAELKKRFDAKADFGMAERLHIKLKGCIPCDKYIRFLKLLSTVADYIPTTEYETLGLLLLEATGNAHGIPAEGRNPLNEALRTIGEYIPIKVKELLIEVFDETAPHAEDGGLERLPCLLKSCADYYRAEILHDAEATAISAEKAAEQAEEPEESVEIKYFSMPDASDVEGQSGREFRAAIPGEDHNEIFRGRIRELNEQYKSIMEGAGKPSKLFIDSGEDEGQVAAEAEKKYTRPPEHNDKPHGVREIPGAAPGGHGRFREEELFNLFGERKGFEPFRVWNGDGAGRFPEQGFPPVIQPGFPPTVPPAIPIFDIKWIQITYRDIYMLPERLWMYANNTFVTHAFRKYGHLILGVTGPGGRRAYYFGVPGLYSERERMRASALGFTSFMPANGGAPRQGEFGYWITKAY